MSSLAGNRLAILTNGGGLGVLAVDRLDRSASASPAISTGLARDQIGGSAAADLGGVLADISPATMNRLDEPSILVVTLPL